MTILENPKKHLGSAETKFQFEVAINAKNLRQIFKIYRRFSIFQAKFVFKLAVNFFFSSLTDANYRSNRHQQAEYD